MLLILLAHPEDAAYFCGGTMIRLARELEWEVHVASMASPSGPTHLPEGAHFHDLEETSSFIFYSERTLEKAIRLLRRLRPRIVITHSPQDGPVDHEVTSVICRAACTAGGKSHLGPPLEAIPHLYYCDAVEGKDALGRPVDPRICIDISDVTEVKAQLLSDSSEYSLGLMQEWARRRGQLIEAEAGEGFRQHLGHGFPQDDLLGDLLGAWPA